MAPYGKVVEDIEVVFVVLFNRICACQIRAAASPPAVTSRRGSFGAAARNEAQAPFQIDSRPTP
jgi:hypothetical protein